MTAKLFPTLTLLLLLSACLPEDCGGEEGAVTLCELHHASCDASAPPASRLEAVRDAGDDEGDAADAEAADASGADAEAPDAAASGPSCGQMCAASCAGPSGIDQGCMQDCLRTHCGGG